MKFKDYLGYLGSIGSIQMDESSVSAIFKMGQNPKLKEEFREALEEASGVTIPVRLKWNNPQSFASEYNSKVLPLYTKEVTKMYHIWGKGSGGPGEMVLAYLCDDIFISDKANIDLRINGTPKYIEMKAPTWLGSNGFVGTFVLGAKYASIEKKLLNGIYKLLDYVETINKSMIKSNDWTAIEKGNMNGATIKVLEQMTSLDKNKSSFELKLLKNGDVFYDSKKITNVNNKDSSHVFKSLANQPSNLKLYNELMGSASKDFEKASTPYFFIGPPGSKESLRLVYYPKLTNLKLKNMDQNGPKYVMEL